MKLEIKEYCIRCGICTDAHPELFVRNFDKDCINVVKDPETDAEIGAAKEAVKDCAVTAIFLHQ